MKKIRAAVFSTVGALVLAAAGTPPSSAATATPSPDGTTVTATLGAGGSSSSNAAAGSEITCTLNAGQYPHNSTHVNGTVNYVATATCDSAVVRITVAATLQPPIPYAPIHGKANSGTVSAQSNAAKACTNGKYYGYASMTVTFPPGYSPNPQTTKGTGPTKDITC